MAQAPSHGPLVPQNGFPAHYADGQGTSLSLCLQNPSLCALLQNVAAPLDGVEFPANYSGTFPDECFYWFAEATMPTAGGGQALLVLALEATFSTGLVLPGDQTTFARMRLRVDNLQAGATYHVTTPYGELDLVAASSGRRSINYTQDIGLIPGNFTQALAGNVFPFLRWDAGLPIVDGGGRRYIGDPNILHRVTGSPTGRNYFRIDGPSVGGPGIHSVSTDLFAVLGMEALPPPVASFTANVTSGVAPLGVAFRSTATGAIGSWDWNFGDGTTSRASNPSKVYTVPGTYTVSLTVTGSGGSHTATVHDMIRVLPPPPQLSITRNDGAGGRLKLAIAFTTANCKLVVLGSPWSGAAPFRAGRCALTTGLAQPAVQEARIGSGSGGALEAELRVPSGLRGQTWYFQVIDPVSCRTTNVVSARF